MNPITSWIAGTSESYSSREQKMRGRVGETSVMAQKLTDERHGPIRSSQFWTHTKRMTDFNSFYMASSAFKGKGEGCVNSFKAHRYYSDEAGKRRDELLKEIAEEEKSSS